MGSEYFEQTRHEAMGFILVRLQNIVDHLVDFLIFLGSDLLLILVFPEPFPSIVIGGIRFYIISIDTFKSFPVIKFCTFR